VRANGFCGARHGARRLVDCVGFGKVGCRRIRRHQTFFQLPSSTDHRLIARRSSEHNHAAVNGTWKVDQSRALLIPQRDYAADFAFRSRRGAVVSYEIPFLLSMMGMPPVHQTRQSNCRRVFFFFWFNVWRQQLFPARGWRLF